MSDTVGTPRMQAVYDGIIVLREVMRTTNEMTFQIEPLTSGMSLAERADFEQSIERLLGIVKPDGTCMRAL